MFKNKLKENRWSQKSYYKVAKAASSHANYPGMIELKKQSSSSQKILDLGCGEGTKLKSLIGKNQKGFGIDISGVAIDLAKRQYPNLTFIKGDLEKLPFKQNTFDLVYAAFVFEHLDKPESVITQAIRVTKPKGKIVFMAPNFGAPNRASPPYKESRIRKLIFGFITDISRLFEKNNKLGWKKVIPILADKGFDIDWDTTIEPYILTLVNYLSNKGLEIIVKDSLWSEELPQARFHQKMFKVLGEAGVYPFVFWGPHLLVVAQKTQI